MNPMATVEYLLKKYVKDSSGAASTYSVIEFNYYLGRAELAREIIKERFGMEIKETATECVAYNSVTSVSVKR